VRFEHSPPPSHAAHARGGLNPPPPPPHPLYPLPLASRVGVVGITGDCGFLMNYQVDARRMSHLPCFISAVMQSHMLSASFATDEELSSPSTQVPLELF